MRDEAFEILKILYNQNGYRLYMIGGTSRDFLLGRDYVDRDFVTDATPEQEKEFLPNAEYQFAKFGSIKVKVAGIKVDITTLRVEGEYNDHRHPSSITFVKNIEEDYKRRDFTINALYIDEAYQVHDFADGIDDLNAGIIRFIGDPKKRIEEDPLRIIRCERFASALEFEIEDETLKAIEDNRYLLDELNPAKIEEEKRKGWVDTYGKKQCNDIN
ncbi:MAG: hypothetical protein MJ220_00080 [Bacilli bacterium]|nr:hypothetical protein [Bacilli bacterium]